MNAIVGGLAILLGAALVLTGARGRRVGPGRGCRRCGYDLSGSPDATRCSECGSDVTAPRAVRVGRRRVRPAFIATGLVLALLGGAAVSPAGRRWADATLTVERAPQWTLRWLIAHVDDPVVDRAIVAMRGRIRRGELTPTQGAALLDALAARQLNLKLRWPAALGEMARDAQSAGLFSESPALTQLIAGSLALEVQPIAPTERPPGGDFINLPHVFIREARGFPRRAIDVDFGAATCAYVDHPTFVSRQPRAAISFGVPDQIGIVHMDSAHAMFDSLASPFQAALVGPGRHAVTIHLDYELFLRPPGDGDGPDDKAMLKRSSATGSVDLAGDADVLSTSTAGAEIDGAAFLDGLRLLPNDLEAGEHVSCDRRGPSFELGAPPTSVPLAATVMLRDPSGRVWPMQALICEPRADSSVQLIYSPMSEADWATFDADNVDVIVESNPLVATYQRVAAGPHLVGRRVWKNVPVLRRREKVS